jgi:hypothetical protein
MERGEELLDRNGHWFETVGPDRGLAELGVSAVVHAQHQGALAAILDAFVDRPGVARPLVGIWPRHPANNKYVPR